MNPDVTTSATRRPQNIKLVDSALPLRLRSTGAPGEHIQAAPSSNSCPFKKLPPELRTRTYQLVLKDVITELILRYEGEPDQHSILIRRRSVLAFDSKCKSIRHEASETCTKIADEIYQLMIDEHEALECTKPYTRVHENPNLESLWYPWVLLKQVDLFCHVNRDGLDKGEGVVRSGRMF